MSIKPLFPNKFLELIRLPFLKIRCFNRPLLPSCIAVVLIYWVSIPTYSYDLSTRSTTPEKTLKLLTSTTITQKNLLCSANITPDCFVTHAQNSLPQIHNQNSRDFARLFIAISQAEMSKTKSSLNMSNSIKDPFLQKISLITIAKIDARAGNSDQGMKTALDILKHVGKSPQAYLNTWLNSLLAEAFAELEYYRQAQSLIDGALETISLVSNYNTRAELFSLIAIAQYMIGDQSAAESSLQYAIDETHKFNDPYLKSLAFSHIGFAQFKIGQIDIAVDTLVLARNNANDASPPSKAVAVAFLAVAQAKTNQINAARNIIHETSSSVFEVVHPYYRAIACAFLAQAIFITEHKST